MRKYSAILRFTGSVEEFASFFHILISAIAALQSNHVMLTVVNNAMRSCDQDYKKKLHLALCFQSFIDLYLPQSFCLPINCTDITRDYRKKGKLSKIKYKKRSTSVVVHFSG